MLQERNTSIYHDIHAEHTLERIWCGHMTPVKNISANRLLKFLCHMKCLLVESTPFTPYDVLSQGNLFILVKLPWVTFL